MIKFPIGHGAAARTSVPKCLDKNRSVYIHVLVPVGSTAGMIHSFPVASVVGRAKLVLRTLSSPPD